MAQRSSEEVDEDERAVFVDTSLNTHIVLLCSPTDTISLVKQKFLLEHPKCFPDFGEIQINTIKVKRKDCYYSLVDSLVLKTAFNRGAKNWFLFADVSSQICMLTPTTNHAVITTGPSETLPILVTSSEHLESGIICNEVDRCRNYANVNKGLGLEMSNKTVSGVLDEFKLAGRAMNPENLGSGNNEKNDKKKKKRTQQHDDNVEKNEERPEELPLNHAGKDGMKSTNNGADEVSPSTRAKKKHKVLDKDVEDISLSKTKTDMQKCRSDDVDHLPPIGDSKHIKKRKKRSSELPSPKINKQDVQEGTQSHYQPEGTRTISDKLVNVEIENDNVELAPESRVKKTKKSEKCDKKPDFLEKDNAPSQNKNTMHALKNSVIGSMEPGTKEKKRKVKKEKVSIQENTDLPSMEMNSANTLSANTLSIGYVENEKNADLSDKADRDGGTHQTDEKVNRVKTVGKFSPDGDQEADNTREIIGAEPLQTAEINKPSISLEIRAEKTKRKTQKKQTVPMKDSPDFSVKERSGEKTAEADTLKADDVNLLVDGDLYKDTNTTPLPEISMDVAEARKTKQHASKKKNRSGYDIDLPSMEKNKDSANTLSIGYVENEKNADLSDKADRDTGTHQTDKKVNRVKTVSKFTPDGDQEADNTREIGAEPLQTAEINKPSISLEIQAEKTKRKTQKKQTVPMKDSPDFSVKERSGEKTAEADTLKADDVNLLVDGDLYKDTNTTPLLEISMDVAEARKTKQHASKKKNRSGYDVDSSKENRIERTSSDDTKLKDDDPKALGTEDLQPPSIDKAEENLENRSDKSKKKTGKKQTALKHSPPMSPMKERIDEETREMAVPKTAGVSLVDDCNEKLDEILPSDSAGLREVRKQDKLHTSEKIVKKLNLPSSSVDTLSIEPSLSKSKRSKKGERTYENETQLKESITVQKQDMPQPQPQPSEKPSETFKKGIETQEPNADPIESMAKLAGNDMGIGSPNRKTRQAKKTKEPQKKLVENPVDSTRSTLTKMGEVINDTSPQKKGLLATGGAIFEDESSGSSDDGDKMDGSDCSTRTPSYNVSSSDYSEGESNGNVVTSQHDSLKSGGQDGANSNSLDFKNLTLHTVLRSSSRYKKAKVLASQSQLDDIDVVPDSQVNI